MSFWIRWGYRWPFAESNKLCSLLLEKLLRIVTFVFLSHAQKCLEKVCFDTIIRVAIYDGLSIHWRAEPTAAVAALQVVRLLLCWDVCDFPLLCSENCLGVEELGWPPLTPQFVPAVMDEDSNPIHLETTGQSSLNKAKVVGMAPDLGGNKSLPQKNSLCPLLRICVIPVWLAISSQLSTSALECNKFYGKDNWVCLDMSIPPALIFMNRWTERKAFYLHWLVDWHHPHDRLFPGLPRNSCKTTWSSSLLAWL